MGACVCVWVPVHACGMCVCVHVCACVCVFQFLKENNCLKEELLKCMGANFLVALANDVYTAFLQSVR